MKNLSLLFIFLMIYGLLLGLTSEIKAQTFSFSNVSWDNLVDADGDGYTRSRRLLMTVTASQATLVKFRYKLDQPPYTTLYTDPDYTPINGTMVVYLENFGTPSTTGEFTHGPYDLYIEMLNASGVILATKSSSNDNDLNNENFETASEVIPTNDLVAYYPFNGNANDESGNGNHGTVFGATLTSDRFGNTNNAFYFNGSTDSIVVPNSSSLNPAYITIAVWVYYEGASYNGHIVSKGPPQYDLFVETSVNDGIGGHINSNPIRSDIPLVREVWTFLCLVKDQDSVYLYKDGQIIKSIALSGPITPSLNNLLIGRHPEDQNSKFKGKIDDIRIYNRALTPQELVPVDWEEGNLAMVNNFQLLNNYPNPFNPSTFIEFELPDESITQLKVYDILGNEVAVPLDNEIIAAGRFRCKLNANNFTSGVYIYVLSAQSNSSKRFFRASKKMILLK